jgi:hypothetical protein
MKLFKFLQANGFSKEQIESFALLLQPALADFITNIYAKTFTAIELKALEDEALRLNLTDLEKDELLSIAYTNKTDRNIDQDAEEFLDGIVAEWEKHTKFAGKILMQLNNLPENQLLEEFNERMRMVEEKYFNDFKAKFEIKDE